MPGLYLNHQDTWYLLQQLIKTDPKTTFKLNKLNFMKASYIFLALTPLISLSIW